MHTNHVAQTANRAVIIAGLVATQACAANRNTPSAARLSSSNEITRDTKGAAHRITAAELRDVEGFTALDAVRRLRPQFLRPFEPRPSWSSATTSVYENDHYNGGVEHLGDIPLGAVVEIEHFSPAEAKAVFGASCYCEGGVVSVKTKAYRPLP